MFEIFTSVHIKPQQMYIKALQQISFMTRIRKQLSQGLSYESQIEGVIIKSNITDALEK